jgi:hypothetical protein
LKASSATASVTVAGIVPTLNFSAIGNQVYGNLPFTVSASSNSPGAISYAVVSGPATISGNTVSLTGSGTVTLRASVAASGSYKAASATTTFTVAPTPATTLNFPAIANQVLGNAPFMIRATSNSPGTVSYAVVSGPATMSGSTVTVTGVGSVTIRASVAASGPYAADSATSTFTVSAH